MSDEKQYALEFYSSLCDMISFKNSSVTLFSVAFFFQISIRSVTLTSTEVVIFHLASFFDVESTSIFSWIFHFVVIENELSLLRHCGVWSRDKPVFLYTSRKWYRIFLMNTGESFNAILSVVCRFQTEITQESSKYICTERIVLMLQKVNM